MAKVISQLPSGGSVLKHNNLLGLNEGDYLHLTQFEKAKLDGIQSGAEVNVNADWNAISGDAQLLNKPSTFPPSAHTHTISEITDFPTFKTIEGQPLIGAGNIDLDKASVGLSNVDNTSDLLKPISTATQIALNTKESAIASGTISQYWRGDKTWQEFPTIQTIDNIPTDGSNNAVSSNGVFDALATKAPISSVHNPVTLGAANGLSLATQQLSLGLASSGTAGALSGTDWNTFNNKQDAFGFTPENVANKQNSLAVDGTGTKYPTVDAVNTGLGLKVDYNLPAIVANSTSGFINKNSQPFIHNFYAGVNPLQGGTGNNLNVGVNSGNFNSDNFNYASTMVGFESGMSNKNGYSNVGIGYRNLHLNQNGFGNSALGTYVLGNLTSGTQNTAIGWHSMLYSTTASENTAIGVEALWNNLVGLRNTALGMRAGASNIGNDNVFIGYNSGAGELGLNSLYIANKDRTLIGGNFLFGTLYFDSNQNDFLTGSGSKIRLSGSGSESKISFLDPSNSFNNAFFDAFDYRFRMSGVDKIVFSDSGVITATSYTGSATLTGTPTAPTAPAGTNTTQVATTAFVANADAGNVKLTGAQTVLGVKTFSSSPVVPTAVNANEAVNKGQFDAVFDALATKFPTPTGLTTNYLPKWNGGGFGNSSVFDNGGNVGIGTNAPSSKLEVAGSIRSVMVDTYPTIGATNYGSVGFPLVQLQNIKNGVNKAWNIENGRIVNGDLGFYNEGGQRVTFKDNGRVLINKTDDDLTNQLQVAGTISASPATTANQVVVKSQLDAAAGISGRYTPTASVITGATGVIVDSHTYTKIGNIVTVYGESKPSSVVAAVGVVYEISLPIARANTVTKAIGFGGINVPGASINQHVRLESSSTTTARIAFNVNAAGTPTLSYSFQYDITQ